MATFLAGRSGELVCGADEVFGNDESSVQHLEFRSEYLLTFFQPKPKVFQCVGLVSAVCRTRLLRESGSLAGSPDVSQKQEVGFLTGSPCLTSCFGLRDRPRKLELHM